MRIRMLKNAHGAPDHIHVERFVSGKVYDVPDELGDAFISTGKAEKSAGAAPENKMLTVSEDKAPLFPTVHRGFGRYDVLDPITGDRINTKFLNKEQAEALAGSQNA